VFHPGSRDWTYLQSPETGRFGVAPARQDPTPHRNPIFAFTSQTALSRAVIHDRLQGTGHQRRPGAWTTAMDALRSTCRIPEGKRLEMPLRSPPPDRLQPTLPSTRLLTKPGWLWRFRGRLDGIEAKPWPCWSGRGWLAFGRLRQHGCRSPALPGPAAARGLAPPAKAAPAAKPTELARLGCLIERRELSFQGPVILAATCCILQQRRHRLAAGVLAVATTPGGGARLPAPDRRPPAAAAARISVQGVAQPARAGRARTALCLEEWRRGWRIRRPALRRRVAPTAGLPRLLRPRAAAGVAAALCAAAARHRSSRAQRPAGLR